jgi:hypothetical protein
MDEVVTHVDRDGVITATLREKGKMDMVIIITEKQLPWFNALKNLLRPKERA